MRILKTFLLLVAMVVVTNCMAQSNNMEYPKGLIKCFLEQDLYLVRNQLDLTYDQLVNFNKLIDDSYKKKMSATGSKNQRKRAIKEIEKNQEQRMKSILTPNQYMNYQQKIRVRRANK